MRERLPDHHETGTFADDGDASLIAAASELLEALQSLQAFVAVTIGRGPNAKIPETIPTPLGIQVNIGAIMRDADAAVAKAEGTLLRPTHRHKKRVMIEAAAAAIDALWSEGQDRGPAFAETEREYQEHCRSTARAALTAYEAAKGVAPDFECEDCIGMRESGCYCAAMGADKPGGPEAKPATVGASLTEQVEGLTRERDEQRVMFLYEADKHSEWLEKFMDMKRRAEVAEAREKRLREALEPFAVEANGWADMWHDDYVPVLTPSVADEGDNERAAFTIGDLRRARAALESKD